MRWEIGRTSGSGSGGREKYRRRGEQNSIE